MAISDYEINYYLGLNTQVASHNCGVNSMLKQKARVELSLECISSIIYSGYVVTGLSPSLCAQSVVYNLFDFLSGFCCHFIPIQEDELMAFITCDWILSAGIMNVNKFPFATYWALDNSWLHSIPPFRLLVSSKTLSKNAEVEIYFDHRLRHYGLGLTRTRARYQFDVIPSIWALSSFCCSDVSLRHIWNRKSVRHILTLRFFERSLLL